MTDTQILTEFDALWDRAMKTPAGPDTEAILALVAAKSGRTMEDVCALVLGNVIAEPL